MRPDMMTNIMKLSLRQQKPHTVEPRQNRSPKIKKNMITNITRMPDIIMTTTMNTRMIIALMTIVTIIHMNTIIIPMNTMMKMKKSLMTTRG